MVILLIKKQAQNHHIFVKGRHILQKILSLNNPTFPPLNYTNRSSKLQVLSKNILTKNNSINSVNFELRFINELQ